MSTFPLYSLLVIITLSGVSHKSQAIETPLDYYDSKQNLILAQKEFKAGNYTEAVFALQRAQAIEPNNTQVGLLLARTYSKLREYSAAQVQYEKIQPQLNEKERHLQEKELAAVLRQKNYKFNTLIGLDFGYDDNLTSLTSAESVFIPATNQDFVFDDRSVKEGTVLRLFGAGSLRYQPDNKQWWRFDGLLSQRQDDTYNQRQFYVAASYHRQIKGAQYNIELNNSYLYGDDLDRRADYNLSLGRTKKLTKGSWSSELKLSQRRYSEQSLRNDKRASIELEYQHPIGKEWLADVSFNVSNDLQTNDKRKDLDYHNQGFSLAFSKPLSDKLKLSFGGNYQRYQYRGEDTSFLRKREDDRTRLQTGLRYFYDKQSSFSGRLEWLHNESNIVLNDYDKKVLTFSYIYRFD